MKKGRVLRILVYRSLTYIMDTWGRIIQLLSMLYKNKVKMKFENQFYYFIEFSLLVFKEGAALLNMKIL